MSLPNLIRDAKPLTAYIQIDNCEYCSRVHEYHTWECIHTERTDLHEYREPCTDIDWLSCPLRKPKIPTDAYWSAADEFIHELHEVRYGAITPEAFEKKWRFHLSDKAKASLKLYKTLRGTSESSKNGKEMK